MTHGDIAKAALWVAAWEGPFHDDPNDPGGATAWGVSLRYHPDLTVDQLRQWTQVQGAAFLATHYWPKNADKLPVGIATAFLAFSVLEGPIEAVRQLQRATGAAVDGQIGPETVAAAARLPLGWVSEMQPGLLVSFYRACMEHLQANSPNWSRDGAGWATRQMAASIA